MSRPPGKESIGTAGNTLVILKISRASPRQPADESTIGLYKTELIKKDGPWRSLADLDLATADYADWFNTARLHTAIGGVPPAKHEAAYYAQPSPIRRLDPTTEASTKPGAFSLTAPLSRSAPAGV
jgi:Integrase core domain